MTRSILVFSIATFFAVVVPSVAFSQQDSEVVTYRKRDGGEIDILQTADSLRETLKWATLREILPLSLATNDGSGHRVITPKVDGDGWRQVTWKIDHAPDGYAFAQPTRNDKRILVLRMRNGNKATGPNPMVEYALRFPNTRSYGEFIYRSQIWNTKPKEGGWTTFVVKEAEEGVIRNPTRRNDPNDHDFQIVCRAKNAEHHIFNATLLIYDVPCGYVR